MAFVCLPVVGFMVLHSASESCKSKYLWLYSPIHLCLNSGWNQLNWYTEYRVQHMLLCFRASDNESVSVSMLPALLPIAIYFPLHLQHCNAWQCNMLCKIQMCNCNMCRLMSLQKVRAIQPCRDYFQYSYGIHRNVGIVAIMLQ